MKPHGVTIQIKPRYLNFHMVLFIYNVVQNFESGDEILWCYHSDETFWAELLSGVIYFLRFWNI